MPSSARRLFFYFNDTATTEIYTTEDTLSLHDALPIWRFWKPIMRCTVSSRDGVSRRSEEHTSELQSPSVISYAVFCLKKKKNKISSTLRLCISSTQRRKIGDIW